MKRDWADRAIAQMLCWSPLPMDLYSKTLLSGTLAIITGYWEHTSQVQFNILFQNHTYIWNTSKWVMNYCEGGTALLNYDTIEDCWSFLVVTCIILSAIFDTWDFWVGARNSFSQAIHFGFLSSISNALLKVISSFSSSPSQFLMILLHYQAHWFYYPQLLQKQDPYFPWHVTKTSAGEVSNNKVSHLERFILGFGTGKSVQLSEASHLLSVQLSEIFITIKW